MSKTIEKYYTEYYNESERLSKNCDNRHKVEIINKAVLIDKYIMTLLSMHTSPVKIKILDLGAGTGIWTDYILGKYNVNVEILCGDIVPKHNEILKEKFKGYNNVTVKLLNALNLPENIGQFDLILCGGPLYHNNIDDSYIIMENIFKVAKNPSFIMVDWLSQYSGEINWSIMLHKPVESLEECDKMFHYKNCDIMTELAGKRQIMGHYAIDSITRFIADEVNKYSQEELLKYCETIRNHWKNTADISEHSITVILKTF